MPFDISVSTQPNYAVTPGFPALAATFAPRVGASGGAVELDQGTYSGVASATVTIGGTIAAGNTVSVVVNGTTVTSAAAIAGDTPTIMGNKLVTAIQANSTVNGIVTAVNNAGVVTLTSILNGQVGQYSLSSSATGAMTAISSGVELDFASVVYPKKTFAYAQNAATGAITYYQGMPREVDAMTKADLKAQGLVS